MVSVGNFATVLSTLGYDVWNVDFETPIIEQGRSADFDQAWHVKMGLLNRSRQTGSLEGFGHRKCRWGVFQWCAMGRTDARTLLLSAPATAAESPTRLQLDKVLTPANLTANESPDGVGDGESTRPRRIPPPGDPE